MAFYHKGKKMGQAVLPAGVASVGLVNERIGDIPASSAAVNVVEYVNERTTIETTDIDFPEDLSDWDS